MADLGGVEVTDTNILIHCAVAYRGCIMSIVRASDEFETGEAIQRAHDMMKKPVLQVEEEAQAALDDLFRLALADTSEEAQRLILNAARALGYNLDL